MERYPKDTPISVEDFNNSGWSEVINKARKDDYSSFWQDLALAAKNAIDDNKVSIGRVLWLLADCCSMMLEPSSFSEPFKPFFVSKNRRSAIPDDFDQSDIEFFDSIVNQIDNPKLTARISDLLWLLKTPRMPEFALLAIDNYLLEEISLENWKWGGRLRYDRALQLCLMLKAGAGDRLSKLEAKLVKSFEKTTKEDDNLLLLISDLLLTYKLGKPKQVLIAEKLEQTGKAFGQKGDLYRLREYLNASFEWYKQTGDMERSADVIVLIAESLVKEAIFRQTSTPPSHMVAVSLYENAIHKYRTIPRQLRKSRNVDTRIEEIRTEMNTAGEQSLNEMGRFSSGPIDISDMISSTKKEVSGKDVTNALLNLANIARGPNVENLRKTAEEMIRDHPLQALVSATYVSKDGRTIAKRPGMGFDGSDSDAVIHAEMVKNFFFEMSMIVQGRIWPALEILRQEHRIQEYEFITIARRSSIVPPGRDRLFAKALYAGYNIDFVTSLHIIVPQIEHLVRFHLKQIGVKTTNIDPNGIENENGLSSLMENAEAKDLFGEDLAFEITTIFCDALGPNLRNELAHGLIDFEGSLSPPSIYAWWLSLRLVFNAYWNRVIEPSLPAEEQDEQNVRTPNVKKSKSGLCHDKSSNAYSRTKQFESFESIEDCIGSGGRLPK